MLLIFFATLYIVCRPEEVCSVLFCDLLINISQLFGDFYEFRRKFLIKSFFPDPFSRKIGEISRFLLSGANCFA
jgi:hypothetical protein